MSRKRVAIGLAVVVLAAVAVVFGLVRGGSAPTATSRIAESLRPGGESEATGTASASVSPDPVIGEAKATGLSPALASLPTGPLAVPAKARSEEKEEGLGRQGAGGKDAAPNATAPPTAGPMPGPIQSFDGIDMSRGCGPNYIFCLPPDPNGEVGLNHYVQMTNSAVAVFTKTGTQVMGATQINQLWRGTGGECELHNDGDPVVLYDQFANRWLLSQFIVADPDTYGEGDQYGECIAISATSDPTGQYFRYEYLFGTTTFHDYPHLGVWPGGYFMTTHEFDGEVYAGAAVFAFERDKMLKGQPARSVMFDLGPSYGGHLPADVDGSKLPPTGSPELIFEVDDVGNLAPDRMDIWKFKVNWSNPSSSTIGVGAAHAPNYTLKIPDYVTPQCVYGNGPNCVPQLASPTMLDTLGDRLMFRAPYRNFGDHESVVLTHTVVGTGTTSIRYYEVQGLSTTPTLNQAASFGSTSRWRFMGSVAMDRRGDMAIGYSASSPAEYPSLRYVGRFAEDAPNTLPQTEALLHTGTTSQYFPLGRWGDYSDLTVDPADDCTFWYTNEYYSTLPTTNVTPWKTRIGSFKFRECTAAK
jgi:hypothetical protein